MFRAMPAVEALGEHAHADALDDVPDAFCAGGLPPYSGQIAEVPTRVIPGCAEGASPETIVPGARISAQRWLWIPGQSLRGAPE
jgi:hypothetical protein